MTLKEKLEKIKQAKAPFTLSSGLNNEVLKRSFTGEDILEIGEDYFEVIFKRKRGGETEIILFPFTSIFGIRQIISKNEDLFK
ncbi:MAG: hypothetical protein LBS33_08735 [Streptococcaceae bacterium]|jgi:hypothetical protein|nr:hypothetical protein [Streptococcaceae bacterium]